MQAIGNDGADINDSANWQNLQVNLNEFAGKKDVRLMFYVKGVAKNYPLVKNILISHPDIQYKFKKNDFWIFPNPSDGEFFLTFNYVTSSSAKTNTLIQIFNFEGKMVMDKEFDLGKSTTIPFNLNYFSPGIYMVKVISRDEENRLFKKTRKIIIR